MAWFQGPTGTSFPCAEGKALSATGLCAAMALPNNLGVTGPGVSAVPSDYLGADGSVSATYAGLQTVSNGNFLSACGTGTLDQVRAFTYFPTSYSNLTVAKVYPGYVNAFGLSQYDGQCSFFHGQSIFGGAPPLPSGLGWFILIGLGGVFSLFTSLVVYLGNRYSGHVQTSEEFSTAGRSIRTGLCACDIVSKWTWAATLLQSSNVAFQYGISGPFWYASGATIQVLLFAVLAVEIKRKCPSVHTALEIVDARWGNPAHGVFTFFMLMTNIIVTAMLILGGASVMNALSGVDLYTAAFLIPMGVVVYTAHGGLKATFIASWAHVAIIYIALCIFMFKVYATYPMLGSPSAVWRHLRIMSVVAPVQENLPLGTYLTMRSQSGLKFGIINIIGNFGTVFVDQAYWQSAIAAKPAATFRGYLLGGMCWFTIPFTLATTMGLAAKALDLPITANESGSGLVPPALATHMMGKGGAFLIVLQVFMAVTASGSAEQIAVSSIFAYDIYRRYMNPNATGKQIVFVARVGVVSYGIISGLVAIALLELGLNLGWVYDAMGIFIGGAVFPLAFALTWGRVTANNAIVSTILSTFAGVIAWMVQAKVDIKAGKFLPGVPTNGKITYEVLGDLDNNLAGGLAALCGSLFICIPWAMIFPQNYDWTELYKRTEANQVEFDGTAELAEDGPGSKEAMDKALSWTYKVGGLLTLILIIVWPALTVPVQGPSGMGDFPEKYWGWWVTLAIMWGLLATMACILLPLWEARQVFINMMKNIFCGVPIPAPEPSHKHVPPPWEGGTVMSGNNSPAAAPAAAAQ